MTDRLDEIRARAEAATPGGELFARMTQECDDCYTLRAQLLRACTYHEGWLDGHGERDPDIDYLLAEVERLQCEIELVKNAAIPAETKAWKQAAMEHYDSAQRWAKDWVASAEREQNASAEKERLQAALDTEKKANVTGWRMVEAKSAGIEQLTADLAAAYEECDRLMDLYLAQRREHNKAVVEVERLRAALEEEA